jgi:hypothetical protein
MEVLEKTVASVQSSYFDAFGRCQPTVEKTEVYAKSRRYFKFEKHELDLQKVYTRLTKHLNIGGEVTFNEFTQRIQNILQNLSNDDAIKNILNGVYVPFMLPIETPTDIGTLIEQKYLPAVEASFVEAFPDKSFTNHHKDGLSGKLAIALGSRHEKLLAKQKNQVIVGVYFPCLMEYSVPAALEQMAKLPEKFLLAGGVDTAAAMVAAPDLLLRQDGYPPVLWMAGLDTEKLGVGYLFEAYGYHLTFNRKPHFDKAAESWASGLVVMG